MRIKLSYRPTAKQRMFHESGAHEVLYGGAAGGGKSYALVMDAFLRCMKHKNTHAYMFRRTFRELDDTLIKTAREIIPKELGKYVGSKHVYKLVNGSEIHFCHCALEKDAYQYRGAEIHWLYIDELTTFTKFIYDILLTRVRAPKRLGIHPLIRCASNPGSVGHAWVKERFVDAGPYGQIVERKIWSEALGKEKTETVQYIPALALENPHIEESYILELEKKPEAIRKAYLMGDWDAFEGQAFAEFVDDPKHYQDGRWTHVIDEFDPPAHWPRYISLDWGFTKPFSVGVWATDERGVLYRYKELYGCKRRERNRGVEWTNDAIGRGIAQLMRKELRDGISVRGVADPALWDASREHLIIEDIERAIRQEAGRGIAFDKGDNKRLDGKMQLHYRLAFDEQGDSMMKVTKNCRAFIETVPYLVYDSFKVEDIDTAGEDHAYDETRYMLMEQPIAARRQERQKPREYDPLA